MKSTESIFHASLIRPVHDVATRVADWSIAVSDAILPADDDGEPDDRYSWVVCVFAFVANVLAVGFTFTTSVFYDALMESLSATRTSVTWIGALAIFSLNGFAIPVGVIISTFGTRTVLLMSSLVYFLGFALASMSSSIAVICAMLGIVCGVGSCMGFLSGVVAVGRYFDKYRALAYGLTASGCGVGTMVMAQLNAYLIERYDWRQTVRIYAVVYLVSFFAIALVFRPRRTPAGTTQLDEPTLPRSLSQLIRDRAVILMMLTTGIGMLGYQVPFSNIVSFCCPLLSLDVMLISPPAQHCRNKYTREPIVSGVDTLSDGNSERIRPRLRRSIRNSTIQPSNCTLHRP